MEFSFAFIDGLVIDAREAEFQPANLVKLPHAVAVGAIPLAGVIVLFILETHFDVAGKASASPKPSAGKTVTRLNEPHNVVTERTGFRSTLDVPRTAAIMFAGFAHRIGDGEQYSI